MAEKLAAMGISAEEFLEATEQLLEEGLLETDGRGGVRLSEYGAAATIEIADDNNSFRGRLIGTDFISDN
ncbi:hypothetical protein [Mycolicibacterium frederiksbergense]|uniref:hypothetical protein n=1 Tax=Mycolicibacterium frederiksbergense TaxID=117567 RepID=UPI00265BF190|nr:hypothetical protein [Mycolicibacterium frederiksbergense]MDO0975157.1 hypothetical protein [Mycolicibacterium frederiksbergense]